MNSGLRVTDGGKSDRTNIVAGRKNYKNRSYAKWIFIVLLIIITAAVCSSFVLFKVKDVQYEGNVHYNKEELNQLIFGTDSPNALHFKLFGKKDKEIPFIEKYDVDIQWPDQMNVVIYEKPIVGYISYMGCNMFFDREGMVVESSSESYENVPEVYGLKFNSIVLNSKLDVGDSELFARILELTQGFDKYELDIDRIIFDSSYDVILEIDDIKVELGHPNDSTERLHILKKMMSGLQGLSGTLQLSDYDGTESSIIFTKEK